MSKNKLKKFAEMETFSNVFQCGIKDLENSDVRNMAGNWRKKYFNNNNPIVLELGCGRGEYTVGLAQKNPDKNYIGIDIKGARMWAGAKQAELAKMNNVAFLRTNIEMIHHFFSEGEVDEIWITFPDPQMKKATKRLTSTYFMERYRQILKPNGIVHLKTDSPFLYTYTEAMVLENNYHIVVNTKNLYELDLTAKIEDARCLQTHYEKQWLDRGLSIKYIVWELPEKLSLIEPDIDIEKDNYRSYGRNYVSTTNN
ncbi:MAG: tRNA (guanosine(46)-N7)-methyltransferase TrmB [Paludibacteraceae bacterium]|nr:tRNA (guanosine(46)-N7)-methyltransferase TrmB [Paludibacteraceae bacterium]